MEDFDDFNWDDGDEEVFDFLPPDPPRIKKLHWDERRAVTVVYRQIQYRYGVKSTLVVRSDGHEFVDHKIDKEHKPGTYVNGVWYEPTWNEHDTDAHPALLGDFPDQGDEW